MPFERPTLSEIRSDVVQDIASALPGADALLRFSNLQILGSVLAGLSHLHYGYLDWIARQAVPFTATNEFLEGWAGLKGVVRKPADQAAGSATFPGVTGAGLPGGSSVVRADGVTYSTTADAVVDGGGNVTAAILADDPGVAGNCPSGTVLTLGQAVTDIQSGGTAAGDITGGADTESDDSLRSRMLEVYQNPPQGGDQSDYVLWALQVPGVTRAWCEPNGMGVGTVIVRFMMDETESAHNGFPQGTDGGATAETRISAATGDQLIVANFIFPLRPVTALMYVVAPTAHAINFTISGLSGASTDLKNQIGAEIADVFLREGTPGGLIDLSSIEAAIAGIAGTAGFVITTPSANITNSAGQLPTLGTITWT